MNFLIIQTAFLGDVILATSVAEKLHQHFSASTIDFLLQKGNESVFENHPFIKDVIILDKKKNKLQSILKVAFKIRKKKYDCIINLHRFGSSGIIVFLSGAKEKIGFTQNPFSFCYTKKIKHQIGNGKHEIERNHQLIKHLTDEKPSLPKLYPSKKDFDKIKSLLPPADLHLQVVCIAPASVWFTKQFPKEKWIELINSIDNTTPIYLLGTKDDFELCENIKQQTTNNKQRTIINLAGQLSILETAALMKNAKMNYVNDSAPLHIASAMNAPVTAIFCSTVPEFGFGPLSDNSIILQTKEKLDCRPCGLHGRHACPKKHFKCAYSIQI